MGAEIVLNLLIMFTDLNCYIVILKDVYRVGRPDHQPKAHVVARANQTANASEQIETVSIFA